MASPEMLNGRYLKTSLTKSGSRAGPMIEAMKVADDCSDAGHLTLGHHGHGIAQGGQGDERDPAADQLEEDLREHGRIGGVAQRKACDRGPDDNRDESCGIRDQQADEHEDRKGRERGDRVFPARLAPLPRLPSGCPSSTRTRMQWRRRSAR